MTERFTSLEIIEPSEEEMEEEDSVIKEEFQDLESSTSPGSVSLVEESFAAMAEPNSTRVLVVLDCANIGYLLIFTLFVVKRF
jgi:hypothetical protein